MSVPDALSRCAPQNQPEHEIDSPSEHDPHFPYVHEKPSVINLPTGQTLSDVLLVSDSDVNNVIPKNADTETEASDNGNRKGIRPQSVNAITAVSVTNKKKRKTKRMGKQPSRPDDMPMQSAIPSTSRSVIDASGSNLSKSCQSNVSSDNFNNLLPSDDQKTECYYGCLDTLPSNQTDSSDRADDNVDDPSIILETRTKRLIESLNVFNSSSFSLATVSTLQKKDPDLSPIITYLENGTLPSSQKLSRQILLTQFHYSLIDGVLFHSCEPKTKSKFVSHDYTLVLPKVLQKSVIDMYHSSPLAAHAGITATLQRVKADFYFERMSVLISDFVKSCDLCQRRKIVRHKKSPATAIPVPSKPFSVWEIDLFGPLPLTAQGNAYVFTAICTFSKFMHAVPLRSKDSISVSNAIFDLCTLYGVPDCLLSDLGTEMTSVTTKHICQLLDGPQQFTPAFSHFVLGGIERVHRSMAE
ncbi:Pol polyprotein [Plakobranchus ocellatus]|uniref:Pol polyprotein n=1 Tax=Plakobranchus ocellatus TaxID=259542 RepID=A0AAV4CMA0_9GAST|nr:Pol polyprotein [Plakobranchus ocellatus]